MKVTCFAGVEYKGKIIFSSFYFNGLCEMDIVTGNIDVVKLFEKEKMISRLHRHAFLYGNEAWFIPQEGKYIACVNLDTGDVMYYDVPCKYENPNRIKAVYTKYWYGVVFDRRYVCLIPKDVDTLSVIDMKEHRIIPLYQIKHDVELIAGVSYESGWIHVLFNDSDRLLKIELLSGRIEEKVLDTVVKGEYCMFNGITYMSERQARKLMIYNPDKESLCSYVLDNKSDVYYGIVELENSWLYLPFVANNFMLVDKLSKKVEKKNYGHGDIFSICANRVVLLDTSNGAVYIVMGGKDCMVELLDDNIKIHDMSINDSKLAHQYLELIKAADKVEDMLTAMKENDTEIIETLELFAGLVGERREKLNVMPDIGNEIWRYIQ
jgi:hypothetical protein